MTDLFLKSVVELSSYVPEYIKYKREVDTVQDIVELDDNMQFFDCLKQVSDIEAIRIEISADTVTATMELFDFVCHFDLDWRNRLKISRIRYRDEDITDIVISCGQLQSPQDIRYAIFLLRKRFVQS